jgi:nucleotide-binding universal stress UspA family protein
MTARPQGKERTMNENKNSNPQMRGVVVVGIDGSASATAALRWSAAEARLRGSRLLVVHAWTPVYTDVLLGGGFSPSRANGSEMHKAAEDLLVRATAGLDAEGVEIEYRAVEGSAPEVLIAAAAEGDLLVVGSRGRGGFAGLLLGSVSQQCAHHASCPVVIVHAPKPAATSPAPGEAAPMQRRAAA